ncbi:Acid phosphatase [Fusarium kuroshium]|uniref:Purple acid phosphatase n=1 Tax=Fusarium kuroshium TaxID=2010991 RepID=A0A3M2SR70_9HYPO|nr:Acid phosphatase [Fusarium kuroshium]
MNRLAIAAILSCGVIAAPAIEGRDVDETYPYTGPEVPVGDWVDPSVNGNGKGFPRLVEPPAVKPKSQNPTNNVNAISLSYWPKGINVHFQTPFGLGESPAVHWGKSPDRLTNIAKGSSKTYDRTPPCSMIKAVTQCSQFFHNVEITCLEPDTTYYYQIPAANGTTQSDVLSFKTARPAGDSKGFTALVINDMGYTNAQGTHKYLEKAVDDGASFAWHGGDISYADDWYSGILPCTDDWPLCYNGTDTELPGGGPIPDEYKTPLPEGEKPNQGGPQGGDMNVIYESNWDLWQQWMSTITTKIPYMVLPGNHEATCSEFDGPNNELTAYLNDDKANGTSKTSNLTYYSCPPSQRNFTAYQYRFQMPGDVSGGVGNFWYSFDYGLAHFVSLNGETDYPNSPESSFARDKAKKHNDTLVPGDTYVTDSGPFGKVEGDINDKKAYQQYQWLEKDLASVDRCKTPWIIVMSHRPLYSSEVSTYQVNMRAAWEELMLKHGVDVYIAGHIHWYERLLPMGFNGTIDMGSVIDNSTYRVNNGKSITHITNGAAGNIESHSFLAKDEPIKNFTQVLDQTHFGFGKMSIIDEGELRWQFIRGDTGAVGDELKLLKQYSTCGGNGTRSGATTTASSGIVAHTPAVGGSRRAAASVGLVSAMLMAILVI